MARVTVITPYFWPEVTASVPLMTTLCEDLVLAGHEVTVVTSLPCRNVNDETRVAFLRNRTVPEVYRGARVLRFPNPYAGRKGVLAKVLEGVVFTVWAMYSAVRYGWKTDAFLVYSNPPLLALPVSMCTLMKRVPIIYNLQDLFPDSAIADGVLKNRVLITLFRHLERLTYCRAAVTASICPSFAQHVLRVCPRARTVVLPNWVDTDGIDYVQPESNEFIANLGLQDKFVVLYAGNMGFAQNLDVVVDAAALLRNRPGIAFAMIGDGQYKESIRDKASRLSLSNMVFLPMQPQERVAEVYSAGDIGLVTVRKGREYSSMPSKTWTIMACRRPVIACVGADSELGRLLTTEGIGLVVPPDSPQKLANAILTLYDDQPLRQRLGMKGRLYVETNLSRKVITSAYSRLLDELTQR